MGSRVPRILSRPGFVSMGVNNSPKTFRPNLWTCVDEPDHFLRSIFLDPRITKFCPVGKRDKLLFDSDRWEFTGVKTRDCPAMNYYVLTHDGFPDGFLTRPDFYWGGWSPKDAKSRGLDPEPEMIGGRSVMHVAIKLLYVLGFTRVFLLGADFRMDEQNHYSFDQNRHAGSVKGNNSTYAKLNHRFAVLRPQFEAAGFHVYNCTPGSHLDAFERMDFMDAADLVQSEFGVDVKHERTYGLYERAGCEKGYRKWAERADAALAEIGPHALKMVRNPGKPRFANRVDRKASRYFKAYRKRQKFEDELLELKHWKGQGNG